MFQVQSYGKDNRMIDESSYDQNLELQMTETAQMSHVKVKMDN